MSIVYLFNVCGHGLILFVLRVNWFICFGRAGPQHGCLGSKVRWFVFVFLFWQTPFEWAVFFLGFGSVHKIRFKFGLSSFIDVFFYS